jgi:hypothetical protein
MPDPAMSPDAQAVLDAAVCHPVFATHKRLAAALCAAADGVKHHWDGMECVDYLCSIAAELEDPQP